MQLELPSWLTNSIATNSARIELTNNVIAPTTQHTRATLHMVGPVQLQLGSFPPESDMVLQIFNLGNNLISWPSGLHVFGTTSLPTNAARIAMFFEEANGPSGSEVWVSWAISP